MDLLRLRASDNENIIKDHKKKDKTSFSKAFFNHLDSKNTNNNSLKNNISYLNRGINSEGSKDSSK